MKPRWMTSTGRLVTVAVSRLVRLSSFWISALRVVPQRLPPSVGGSFPLLLLLLRQPGRLSENLKDAALARLQRRNCVSNVVDHLAVAYLRVFLVGGGVVFWWRWLRLVHKHGWEKAVVDAKCRFWGFKFLPNV